MAAVDAIDEGGAEPVDAERPGNFHRLAGGDVGGDFGVGRNAEPNRRYGAGLEETDHPSPFHRGKAVAGVQAADGAPQFMPARHGLCGIERFAEHLGSMFEDAVTAEHQGIAASSLGDSQRFATGHVRGHVGGWSVGGLIHAADHPIRLKADLVKQLETSRTGRSQDQARADRAIRAVGP